MLLCFFLRAEESKRSAGLALQKTSRVQPCILIKNSNFYKSMRIFKNIPADKIGNFILTVITAFVSTFLMQSCIMD